MSLHPCRYISLHFALLTREKKNLKLWRILREIFLLRKKIKSNFCLGETLNTLLKLFKIFSQIPHKDNFLHVNNRGTWKKNSQFVCHLKFSHEFSSICAHCLKLLTLCLKIIILAHH